MEAACGVVNAVRGWNREMKRRQAYTPGFSLWASAAALITTSAFLFILQGAAGHEIGGIISSGAQRLSRFQAPERDATAVAVLQERDESLSSVSKTHHKRGGWFTDRTEGWKPAVHDPRPRVRVSEKTALSAPMRTMVLRL